MSQRDFRIVPNKPTKAAFLEALRTLIDDYGVQREAATLAANGGPLDEKVTARVEVPLSTDDMNSLAQILTMAHHPEFGPDCVPIIGEAFPGIFDAPESEVAN